MRRLDFDRLETALVDQDLDELEACVPDGLQLDDPGLVAAVAGAVLVAALLRYLAASPAAAESGVETTRLLLQAIDVACDASPELRGLILLLGLVAAIKTLRSRS